MVGFAVYLLLRLPRFWARDTGAAVDAARASTKPYGAGQSPASSSHYCSAASFSGCKPARILADDRFCMRRQMAQSVDRAMDRLGLGGKIARRPAMRPNCPKCHIKLNQLAVGNPSLQEP